MSLTKKFASEFETGVRSRGHSYYVSGYVRIKQGDFEEVVATVRGSENYRVDLDIDGKKLLVSCTCPYAYEDFCKHIWATMLAADAGGFLTAKPEPTSLRLNTDDYDDWDDDDDDDDEVDYYNRGLIKAAKPST